jgi:hypothetical protein
MLTSRHIAAAVTLSSIVLIGGCATTHGGLSSSADRLERNAETLARNADDDYSRDARELADQAQDFRQAVQDRRADDGDIRSEFEKLSREYHALRDEIDRSDSREAQMDFRAVTEAYLDIEREMSEYDRDRYASDDDRDDRRKRF